jgi:hypothetical protein
MRNIVRYVVTTAALIAGLALMGSSRADAQVGFTGTFPLPHGQISIGIGDPYFHVGAFVPVGYQIYARSGYGYGFAYNDRWIPVRPSGGRWLVCGHPYFDDAYYNGVYYDPSYGAGHGGYYGAYYVRPSHRYVYHRASYPRADWHRSYAPYYRGDHNANGHQGQGSSGNRDRGNDHGGNRHGDRH